MLFTEEDSPALKTWIVNRLADTSDADADVLADYVLALLRQDADLETVRQLCLAEIPDFLKKDSAVFVEDLFDAIKYKSYLPGAAPPPPRGILSSQPPTDPSAPSYGELSMGGPLGNLNGGRKRSYNDRGEGDFQNGGYQQGVDPNGRQFKQPRRGGPGMGRGNSDNPNFAGRGGYDGGRGGYDGGRGGFDGGRGGFDGGRGGFDGGRGGYGGNRPPSMNNQGMPGPGFQTMPALPNPPPGMPPFDPNNPIASILAMQQVMGLPIPPGMPQFPLAAAPGPVPGLGFRGPPGPPTQRRKVRCRDYDEAGFCSRGNTCMFEHGEHAVWTPPPKNDEYNPNTSLMAGTEGNASAQIPHVNLRGGVRGGRGGRGGAGGRGDFTNTRKNGRSEFSSDRPNFDKSNTSIVIENIPEEKFTEDEVRSFFAEFGTILEVEMRAYKRLAIIKFEDWDSAQAAYKSPKVIFDNRFVKVYWYTNSESLPQPPSGTKSNDGASFSAPAYVKAEPEIDIEEFTRKQQELQKVHEEKMKKKQEVDTARQALEKRQEELLRSQAEMLEKIAAKSGKPLATSNGIKQETPEPSQTDQLKAQLAALEAEAHSLGIDTTALPDQALGSFPPRGGYRGRGGGYRGRGAFVPRGRGGYEPRGRGGYRGRGAPFAGAVGGGVMRLDNRPKTVSMTGVDFTDSEKDESLRQYLLGVGEYISIDVTPTITSITFKERFVAEKFMYSTPGCEIPSAGRVEMAWVKNALPQAATSSNTNSSSPVKSEIINASHKDVNMLDEGDAMSGSRNVNGNGNGMERETNQNQNLDYDVADDEFF